jgi:hypothetical protein
MQYPGYPLDRRLGINREQKPMFLPEIDPRPFNR